MVQTESLKDDHHAEAAAAAGERSEHCEDGAESGPRPGGGQEPRAESRQWTAGLVQRPPAR